MCLDPLRIWWHLLNKSLLKNFIFCAVDANWFTLIWFSRRFWSFSYFQTQPYAKCVQIRSFFWSIFSRIHSECWKIRTIKNSIFGHVSRSAKQGKIENNAYKWVLLYVYHKYAIRNFSPRLEKVNSKIILLTAGVKYKSFYFFGIQLFELPLNFPFFLFSFFFTTNLH